ncbi:ATP-dependent Zn protease [Allocoleopsis sp.]|uniref:ATP-dependent Zn protease n=1 Tax=Allocoleopsis sp. TaxID=3088169 RepID=UPI002FD55658
MEQTALNLIAIGVFGMTLSALLGPMFNISPVIPAVTTLGVLSLATLDSFNFQGKGATLLIDWLAGTRSQHRDRILRHEAGHFLVAYLLGIPITGYTLTAWEAFKQGQPGLGGVTFDTEVLSPDVLDVRQLQLTLDRFCKVWMAGIAAETLVYGSAEGGVEDRQKLRETLTLLGRQGSEFQLKERLAIRQAQTLIQEHWESYEALVAALEQRASVAECYQVIQQHYQSSEVAAEKVVGSQD